MAREEEVRLIAYRLWEEEGCPNGRDCDHWLKAEAIWEEASRPQPRGKADRQAPASKSKARGKTGKK
jgi:hypothetical protein